MKETAYIDLKNSIIAQLNTISEIVLSTSYQDRVTSRTISIVNDGLSLFFLTLKTYRKYKQIGKNSQVALCFENLQIEGHANIRNHPDDIENSIISHRLKKGRFADIYSKYSKYENCVLIEVIPQFMTRYLSTDDKPYFEYLDIKSEKAFQKG